MNDNYFVDSNVWLYAFMESSIKADKATEIINAQSVILSTQVVNEVCVNLLKKAKYTEEEIKQTIHNIYTNYDVAVIHQDIILYSSEIRENCFISYWDSLIVATAIKNDCSVIYSEDMQHNQIIGKLKIVNPFK